MEYIPCLVQLDAGDCDSATLFPSKASEVDQSLRGQLHIPRRVPKAGVVGASAATTQERSPKLA